MHGFDAAIPTGGLDMDSTARNVADTDYVYALNVQNAINAANRGDALTNILGNLNITKYTLPYGGTSSLPLGVNRCIGAFEDTKYNTVVFCVWNSNGEHQILRYYRNKTSPTNPYGEVQQIISYDFGWTKDTRITSGNFVYGDPDSDNGQGDLFYWCDPVPKKINLTKANICEKQKSWTIYLPLSAANQAYFFQVIVRNFATNGAVASINVNVPPNLSIEDIFATVAAQINSGLSTYITADACDCSMGIIENAVNQYTVAFSLPNFVVVPENWYGTTLIDRFWDRCKWQPMNAPLAEYLQDVNFLPNYVKRKVFQFRLEYIYDDGEQSALGVWSQIPINNLGCNGTSNESLNYIDVNFNDSLIVTPETLVLLKRVRFIARELNTGNDKAIIDLEPCEFLDLTGNTFFAHFKFYNNIISNTIDPALAAKLFDNVPLESNAEQFVKNRMIEGGIVEGYDAPECPKASYTIDFSQNPNPTLYRVKIRVRILSYGLGDAEQPRSGGNGRNFYSAFPNYEKYPFWISSDAGTRYALNRGGIFHDTTRTDNNFPFFGGGGFGTSAGGDFAIRAGMETDFDQRIPEGGFPIYAAGTPYFGISKQINVNLPTDGVGALETSTLDRRDAIGRYLYCGSGGTCSDLYSEVEILVPAGEYVFRAASHWCSFGDVLGKGFMYDLSSGQNYQKTSTNVWGVFDPNGNWVKEKEIRVVVNADVPNAGTFLIMDLAPPADFELSDVESPDIWQPLNVYLLDSLGNSDINSDSFAGVSVEKAGVLYQLNQGWGEGCTTDHNGYFFGITIANSVTFLTTKAISGQDPNSPTLPLTILNNSAVFYYGSLTDIITKNTQAYNWNSNSVPPSGNGYSLVAAGVATDTPNARALCSTFINGDVVDTGGNAVSGVLVVYENGRVATTLNDGSYSLIAWADMVTANLPNFPIKNVLSPALNRIVDALIFQLNVFCQPVYPNGQSTADLQVDPIGGTGYNPTNPFLVADFIIDENNNPALKARKRGGQYIDGIRYYDNAGRLCSVVKLFDLYVPFETEDLNKTLPNQYPANTYIQGKPVINWAFDASFQPPTWAAYYQFVRTKNLIYGRYLQWIANQVTYLSAVETDTTPEIETSFANGDAVAIKVSLSNIITYQSANNDSQIGYNFQQGDRLRLMTDRILGFYQGINDFEITSYDETTQSVIIKIITTTAQIESGSLIEIFNPKSIASEDEQIFYEVGETFKCTAPNTPNNQHSVTSGTFTNGDTYWRGRLIIVNDSETKFAAAYPVTIEDASVSDFYPSEAQDIGRVGIIDPNFKRIDRPMLMRFSNSFIPSTAVNGLSSFEELNSKELDRAYGQIQRMVFTNNNLVVIGSLREISNYIQRVTFYQASSEDGQVALSDAFFGTEYVHSKQLGTDFPATISVSGRGTIFGWTNYMANVWRYQGDGEAVISDVRMVNFFKTLSDVGITDAVSVYDRFHEEYIVTYWRLREKVVLVSSSTPVSGGYDIRLLIAGESPELNSNVSIQILPDGAVYAGEVVEIDGAFIIIRVLTDDTISLRPLNSVNLIFSLPETIAWFEGNDFIKGNKWISFRSYTPECYCALGDEVVSFKDGYLWIQDKSSTRNNFFGTQYSSVYTPMYNAVYETPKAWHSFNLKQYQDNGGCDWAATMTNLNGQLSRINKANWVQKEEFWYTPCKRDLTDDSVPANQRIINGRMIRSSTLEVRYVNDYTGAMFINEAVARYQISQRSTS